MTAREWLEKAKKEHFAIGAFNVGNLETFKAIVQAAVNKKSPVIIESSPGETKWMGADNVVDLARNFSQDFNIPIFVNLDHGESLEDCKKAVEAGYDLIHFDGGKLPYDQYVQEIKKLVDLAHQKGLMVEGEIDHIAGSSEVHPGSAADEMVNVQMTDPEKAGEFVKNTGVDIFAAFFGNVHGMFSGGGENLNFELLKKIASEAGCFLSLHGGSGIADGQVKEAIRKGVVKVNINTELRQAFKNKLQEVMKQNPAEYAMYKLEGSVVASVQKVVEHKIDVFGSAGQVKPS